MTAVPLAAHLPFVLHFVELLLLLRSEKRPELCHGVVHDCLHLLHSVAPNVFDLRPGLINDRLRLCLLVRREIQLIGYSFDRSPAGTSAAAAAPTSFALSALRLLCKGGAAE